jgi:hypothetical protein
VLTAAIEDIEVIPQPEATPVKRTTSKRVRQMQSAGPRFGVLQVVGPAAEALKDQMDVDPTLTAWGWQWEFEYQTSAGGPTGLIEVVPMVIGLEQGLGIPSLNTMFGVRKEDGIEFAVGPNVSVTGIGLTMAVGYTFRSGPMRLPVNIAWVSGKDSDRFSLTFGWNIKQ